MKKIISLLIISFFSCLTLTGCATIFVPKTYGIGWTLNWSNPISWLIILVIIGLIIWKFINNRKNK